MIRLIFLAASGVVLLSVIGAAERLQPTVTQRAATPLIACPPAVEVRLAGITLSDDTNASQALIEEVESGQQHLLKLSDSFGSYRLSSMSPDGAVFSGDNCAGQLSLTLTEGRSRKTAVDLSQTLNFSPAESTQLVSVLSGSLLDRLGLKPGDTVAAVNGHNVQDSEAAKAELSRLNGDSLDSVSVKRDGRMMVFVNPESTAVRNFTPPQPSSQRAITDDEGAPTVAAGMALPGQMEDR